MMSEPVREHDEQQHEQIGKLLRFPGVPEPQVPARSDSDDSPRTESTEVVPQQQETSQQVEPATEAPHRAAHIPKALRRAGQATWAGARRVAPHALHAARFAGRHAYLFAGGAWDLAEGVYKRATGRDIDERIAAAQAAGDHGTVAQLQQIRATERRVLIERMKVLLEFGVKLPKALAWAAGLALALAMVAAIAAQAIPGGTDFAGVWTTLAEIVDTSWDWVVTIAQWSPVAAGAVLAGALIRAYNNRRRSGRVPASLATPASKRELDDAARTLVTADGIVRALQHLPIPALSRAFKDGWQPTFALIPTREGEGQFKGWRAVFDLPMGVTPAMLSDKRDVLARNLSRNPIEVWPTDDGKKPGGRPGFVDLYVADVGVMDKPTPAYPLLTDGVADVFAGVPIGITQRGEQVNMPLVGSNFVVGGLPGQGKSNAMRVIMLGAALDPLCELRAHVFAANGDFDVYAPRLSRYVKGVSVEHAEEATEHLRELHAEIARREGRLAEIGAKKLTRSLSAKHPDLRPIVVAFSECHELFGDDEVGEEATELATDIIKRGRKTGVIVGFDTQSARAGAMPPKIVENVGVNCCFYVKTWRNNDGFLGDGSFAAGIRATELRYNVDRGTMMTTGITDEQFELLRTYFIEVDDDRGWDAAEDVIRRAMEIVDPATPVQGSRPQRAVDAEESRDLLADVTEVLRGEPKVKTVDVAARLRELAPGYRPYKGLDGAGVKKLLAAEGVRVTMSDGYPVVRPERVAEAIARRDATQE